MGVVARLEHSVDMKNKAEIVERRLIDEVDVGSTVTIQDVASAEERTFVVGSYRNPRPAARQ